MVPDLTPFVVPERDLTDPVAAERGYRALGRLRRYDAILTPSLTTRGDVIALLGLPPERVFAIGNAADGLGFRPEDSLPMPLEARRVLHGLGIRRAFLLVDAGYPGQKTVERMLEVYRMLPERLRLGYQLVFTGPVPEESIERARALAEPPGGEQAVFTGPVSEAALRPPAATLRGICPPGALRRLRTADPGGNALRRRGGGRQQLGTGRAGGRRRTAGRSCRPRRDWRANQPGTRRLDPGSDASPPRSRAGPAVYLRARCRRRPAGIERSTRTLGSARSSAPIAGTPRPVRRSAGPLPLRPRRRRDRGSPSSLPCRRGSRGSPITRPGCSRS